MANIASAAAGFDASVTSDTAVVQQMERRMEAVQAVLTYLDSKDDSSMTFQEYEVSHHCFSPDQGPGHGCAHVAQTQAMLHGFTKKLTVLAKRFQVFRETLHACCGIFVLRLMSLARSVLEDAQFQIMSNTRLTRVECITILFSEILQVLGVTADATMRKGMHMPGWSSPSQPH